MASEIQVIGVRGIPEVKTGDDIVSLIAEAGVQIEDGDILVVTQKIVSKAEGRVVRLADINPSAAAFQLSSGSNRDPRLTEVILRETVRIVRVPCRFGGTRPYFICPGVVNGIPCGRRVVKLHGPER